jgi:putative endonuclease
MEPPRHSSPDRLTLGLAAEERAARHLAGQGLDILLRNWRCRMGELDLVARDGDVLVIAEVRLRHGAGFGNAAASITSAKRRRIIRATRHLLMRRPEFTRLRIRFDVVTLDGADETIEWIRAAFDAC